MYNPRFVGFLLQMNTNTSDQSMLVLYPNSSVVSSVISSCFICELILKVHKIGVFQDYTLACVSSGNLRSKTPPCLRNSNRKYPPMPSDFQFKESPLPSEFRKAVRGMVWIFSGIAHFDFAIQGPT